MKTENEKTKVEGTASETESAAATEPDTTNNCETAVCLPEDALVEKAIRESVYASMGIGIVPVPLFNIAAVTVSNLNLARKLSRLYGIEFKEGAARKIIAAITSASAGVLASPIVETAVIGLPLVGIPLAVGTKTVLNGMTTYAVGRMFVTHFSRGGSFFEANIGAMKEDFNAAYQNSRQWLGNAISGKQKTETASA